MLNGFYNHKNPFCNTEMFPTEVLTTNLRVRFVVRTLVLIKVSKIEDLSQSIWLNLSRKMQRQHRKLLGDRK